MSGIQKTVFFLSAIIMAALIFGGANASALSSNPKTFVSADNSFYVYVESGEKVDVSFTKVNTVGSASIRPQPIQVFVDAPGLERKTCSVAADVADGDGCKFEDLVAVKDGVWRVQFKLPDDAHVHNGIVSSVKWGAHHFSWDITVSDDAGEKKGRLWSELYAVVQPTPRDFLADLTFYYQSEDGYLYRAIYRGYNGGLSTLSADAFGMVKKNSCTPVYRSISADTTTAVPSSGTCGGSYKLFFEQPSDELPSEATRWDNKKEWVRTKIDRPVVSGLTFTPDSRQDAQSGEIKYTLKNFIGQYEVKIDTNNDGNFDGPSDVTFKRQAKDLKKAQEQKVRFNGENRDGELIPRTQHIRIKIRIAKAAEIHLVGADIEGREGGIELVRLHGDNAPSANIYWDDTQLDAVVGNLDKDLKFDGTAGPESIGGVHGWLYNTDESLTWGNARYIDDWTYATARVSGVAEITYPSGKIVDERSTGQTINIVAIAGGIFMIAGIAGGTVYIFKRRQAAADKAFITQATRSTYDERESGPKF